MTSGLSDFALFGSGLHRVDPPEFCPTSLSVRTLHKQCDREIHGGPPPLPKVPRKLQKLQRRYA